MKAMMSVVFVAGLLFFGTNCFAQVDPPGGGGGGGGQQLDVDVSPEKSEIVWGHTNKITLTGPLGAVPTARSLEYKPDNNTNWADCFNIVLENNRVSYGDVRGTLAGKYKVRGTYQTANGAGSDNAEFSVLAPNEIKAPVGIWNVEADEAPVGGVTIYEFTPNDVFFPVHRLGKGQVGGHSTSWLQYQDLDATTPSWQPNPIVPANNFVTYATYENKGSISLHLVYTIAKADIEAKAVGAVLKTWNLNFRGTYSKVAGGTEFYSDGIFTVTAKKKSNLEVTFTVSKQ